MQNGMNKMDDKPKMRLSIITVTYNAEQTIGKTLQSLLEQTGYSVFLDLDYIFIDGKSKDHTWQIFEFYRKKLSLKNINVIGVCEKDNGIYDAMNKGIRLAAGDWVYILNSGDIFYSNSVLQSIGPYLSTVHDVVYGTYFRSNKYYCEIVKNKDISFLKKTMFLCHQAVFIKRELSLKYQYDVTYQLAADYNTLLRLYLAGYSFKEASVCIINYNVDGMSAKHMVSTYKEIFQIRKKNGVINNPLKDYMIFAAGIIKRELLASLPPGVRWNMIRYLRNLKHLFTLLL